MFRGRGSLREQFDSCENVEIKKSIHLQPNKITLLFKTSFTDLVLNAKSMTEFLCNSLRFGIFQLKFWREL